MKWATVYSTDLLSQEAIFMHCFWWTILRKTNPHISAQLTVLILIINFCSPSTIYNLVQTRNKILQSKVFFSDFFLVCLITRSTMMHIRKAAFFNNLLFGLGRLKLVKVYYMADWVCVRTQSLEDEKKIVKNIKRECRSSIIYWNRTEQQCGHFCK